MRLTDRDVAIVDLVFRCRALRADQIHLALFPTGSDSRSQLRLTLLVRNRYLDRLPRQLVNEPAVYLLTRFSVAGNRLMRVRYGVSGFRSHLTRLGSLGHLLAVNDLRVRVERACRDLGWTLARWDRPEELAPLLKARGLVPDAYFQIKRPEGEGARSSGFFVEAERSVKSVAAIEGKLKRYLSLYRSGRYEALFGTRALRILFVFTDEAEVSAATRVGRAVRLAAELDAPLARFASLTDLKQTDPEGCFVGPHWWRPGEIRPCSLFNLPTDGWAHHEKED